jgi:hypothetical protein
MEVMKILFDIFLQLNSQVERNDEVTRADEDQLYRHSPRMSIAGLCCKLLQIWAKAVKLLNLKKS